MDNLSQLFSFVNDKVILIENGKIVEIKPKVLKMLGLSNDENIIGQEFNLLIDHDFDELNCEETKVLSFSRVDTTTINIPTTIKWFNLDNRKILGLKLKNLDFLYENVSKLEQLEDHFNAILTHSPFHILIVDAENRLSFINRVGDYYQGEGLNKVPMTTLLQPEYETLFKTTIANVRKENQYKTIKIQGQSKGWYRMHMIPLQTNSNDVMILGEEITEQVTSKKELQRLDLEYKYLIQQLPLAVTIVDENGNFIEVNQKTIDLLGYSRDELLQMSNLDIVADESRYKVRQVGRYLERKNSLTDVGTIVSKSGKNITVDFSSVNITHRGKKLRLSVLRDITEQIKFQDERDQLLTKIARDQRVESLGILVGGIAHDFNNYLTAILGNTELMKVKIISDKIDQQELIDQLNGSMDIIENASNLTKQLLAYAGNANIEIHPLNINQVIEDLSNLVKLTVPSDIEIEYNLSKDLPPVLADITQLQQYFLNLLTNSSEALSSSTNGRIKIRTFEDEIDPSQLQHNYTHYTNEKNSFVVIEISDNGYGIDPKILEKIFDPFYSTKSTGRGLGLSVVLGIVRGHNGAIDIKSQKEKGTKFSLYLPTANVNAFGEKTDGKIIDLSNQYSGKVVVADDDPDVLKTKKNILESMGFQVFEAENGLQVLQHIKNLKDIEFLLIDVTMPKLDGITTVGRIREILPQLPIVLMSGYSDRYENIEDLVMHPRTHFISKPFTLPELLEIVSEYIS